MANDSLYNMNSYKRILVVGDLDSNVRFHVEIVQYSVPETAASRPSLAIRLSCMVCPNGQVLILVLAPC
jgi:hypothetical protein